MVPVVEEFGAAVVSGGTDAGVMWLLGQGRPVLQASFSRVGLAAVGAVRVPGRSQDGEDLARLEPHPTQFVLVPGEQLG